MNKKIPFERGDKVDQNEINAIIDKLGIKKNYLATLLGVSKSYITDLINGKIQNYDKLQKLKKILKVYEETVTNSND